MGLLKIKTLGLRADQSLNFAIQEILSLMLQTRHKGLVVNNQTFTIFKMAADVKAHLTRVLKNSQRTANSSSALPAA